MSDVYIVKFSPNFPLADVEAIAADLIASGALVPGYIPSPVGFLDLSVVVYGKDMENWDTVILPDRNLASRMAQVAKFGATAFQDEPSRIAVNLMAFAQAVNWQMEPSIAFHELAHLSGNDTAHEELRWFRAADQGPAASAWIDLARGRRDRVELAPPAPARTENLAYPLHRWSRNHVVALKIAELELAPMGHLDRALALLDWMFEDFLLAGPAGVFATMYFSPSASRRRLIKKLRSPDRQAAIDGVRNAAWDITHLSDFIRKVSEGEQTRTRYVFATADKSLAALAPLLLLGPDETEDQPSLIDALDGWWPEASAQAIGARFFGYVDRIDAGERSPRTDLSVEVVNSLIAEGERKLLNWRP